MTAVTSAPNPSTIGQQITITATVSPSGPPAPTGTVGFTSNGTEITEESCSAVPLSSSTAVCTTSALAVGTDAIVATYLRRQQLLRQQWDAHADCESRADRARVRCGHAVPHCGHTQSRRPVWRTGDQRQYSPRVPALRERQSPSDIPSNSALAYSLNVTVVPSGRLGYLTIWPTGEGQPSVSTMNSPDGRVKANAAIVPAGTSSGSVSVFVANTTNVLLDIDGYFATPTRGSLQFYPLTPCRIVDTRNGQNGGSLQAGVERDYTIPPNCHVPGTAAAYSFNVTVVPNNGTLDYLTVWPQGEARPTVSTLNDNTGTLVANAAIVPAGDNSATAFYAQ